MGRQINFFLHPDDQSEFDKLVKSCGDVVMIPYYHYQEKVSIVETSVVTDREKNGNRIYLVRPQDLECLQLEYFEKFNYWLVDDTNAPVIEFDISLLIDNYITRGRLYFKTDYLEDNQLINKPEDFIKWGDKLLRTFRRKLKRHKIVVKNGFYNAYLGENALNWVEQNDIIVGPGGYTLEAVKFAHEEINLK